MIAESPFWMQVAFENPVGVFQIWVSRDIISVTFCVCVYVSMCAHMCVLGLKHAWTRSCRTQRTTQSTFSSCCLIWFHLWDSVSQWTRCSSIWQDQLILKPQGFACLHYRLSTGITVTSWHTWCFMWVEGIPNSQTHVCPASTLQPVLPPQPANFHTLQVRWPVWSNVFLFVPYSFHSPEPHSCSSSECHSSSNL